MQDSSIRTYQTRLRLDETTDKALLACAELFAHVEHSLFRDVRAKKSPKDLKSQYLKKYGITARHFNAFRVKIEGKIASIQERCQSLISEISEQIKSVEEKLSQPKRKKSPLFIHQKKRRLHQLKQRLQKLQHQQEKGNIALCFGSKKLFRAQFNLEANGFKNHEEWQTAWRFERKNELFFLGSKDESGGNQSCTLSLEEDKTFSLRIRLPDALITKFGKYLRLTNIHFAYGQENIIAGLIDCRQRQLLSQVKDPNYRNHGQALSCRFKRDKKGWSIFVTTTLPKPQWKTDKNRGVIGVDINTDHLALVETDRFGNPLIKETIPLNLYGKTQKQALALIGDACANVIAHAEKTLKPVVLEDLDFQKKKRQLREKSTSFQARKLSSFSYQSILTHIKSRGWSKQIEVYQVNPAYTSLIGRVKFSNRYGLSIHHAAALCIGRRFLNFSEKIPRHLEKIPDGRNGHVALSLPVRNRDQHVWTFWRSLSKKLKVALAAHFRTQRSLSTLKAALETGNLPDLVGETPAHESSTQLLGWRLYEKCTFA